MVSFVMNSYLQSKHVVVPQLIINVVFVFVNLGLNYLMVYGAGRCTWPRACEVP